MKIGAAIFLTNYSTAPIDLAVALARAQRGRAKPAFARHRFAFLRHRSGAFMQECSNGIKQVHVIHRMEISSGYRLISRE